MLSVFSMRESNTADTQRHIGTGTDTGTGRHNPQSEGGRPGRVKERIQIWTSSWWNDTQGTCFDFFSQCDAHTLLVTLSLLLMDSNSQHKLTVVDTDTHGWPRHRNVSKGHGPTLEQVTYTTPSTAQGILWKRGRQYVRARRQGKGLWTLLYH